MPSDKEAHFDVTATDKSGPAVRAAAQGLDALARKESEASREMRQLERQTAQLRNKMLETAAAAKVLGHEFAKTGDNKVLRDFEKMSREADRLGRVLKKIEPPKVKTDNTVFGKLFGNLVKEAKKAGKLAGETTIESFGDVFKAIPPEAKLGIAAGLVGAAALAAPVIAAAVEGAVLAGVGAAGIGAGIALAARDPAVVQAYAALGEDIMKTLNDAVKPFKAELLTTAPKLGKAFDAESDRIRDIFATLSTAVGPLVDGVVGAVHQLLPGVQKAAAAAVPLLKAVAAQLPSFGKAIGGLLESFARGGPGATAALTHLVDEVIVLIDVLAFAARQAAPFFNLFEALNRLSGETAATSGKVGVLSDTLDKADRQASQAATDYGLLAQSMGNTANQADALNASYSRLFSEAMNLDQANLAVKQGMLNIKESVKENGTALDENSQKGLNNIGVIQQQISNLEAKRQADIAAGNGTVEATNKANAAYASNLASLRQVLINLGFAAGDVDKLIGKYQALAAIPDITIKVTTVYDSQGRVTKAGQGNSQGAALSAFANWAPAQFAARQRLALASGDSGTFRTGGPVQVTSTVDSHVRVDLDGRPFRDYVQRAITGSEQRQNWRAKVGPR